VKVLIFGGSGFIGAKLCNHLLECGYAVEAFDNNERGHESSQLNKSIKLIRGDICNYSDVLNAVKGNDIVFNLAFINGTKNFYSIPGRILEIAAAGQLNVGRAINEVGVSTFVYASSSEAYQTPEIFPTSEEVILKVPDPANPRYSYGGGKIFGELCTYHHVVNASRKIIFRPHNVYGPHMGSDHVIPALLDKIKCAREDGKESFPVAGDPKDTRSFLYVDDCCKALRILIEKQDASGIYNVGSGLETTIGELVDELLAVTGSATLRPIFGGDRALGGVTRRLPDVRKLKSHGWEPSVSLSDGLEVCWSELSDI